MRVLYDVFELSPRGGKSIGIYHYARQLLAALVEQLPDDVELVLPCHGDNIADFSLDMPGELLRLAPATPGKLARQWWTRHGIRHTMRRHDCDLYFTPKGFLPGWWGGCQGIKTCAVVHDLIPLWYAEHHPGYFGWLESLIVNQGLARTCRHADGLITISQAAAHDIRRRLTRAKTPTVIHNGMTPPPRMAPRAARESAKPFMFAMTSTLPHKNAAVLLEAYRLYRAYAAEPLDLVVCGLDGCDQPGVTAVKGITPARLHAYYRDSVLFVFLSLTEGFGFPPLEAMLHGTPTLCADIEVLRETTRGNAVFVNPTDPAAVARQMAWCLSDQGAGSLAAIRASAASVVDSFSWRQCASEVLAVWLQTIRS